jgi:hypothetical protein
MQPYCLATVDRESNGKLAVSLFYQWHVWPVTMQFELKVTSTILEYFGFQIVKVYRYQIVQFRLDVQIHYILKSYI